ncbi:hypothetical protein CEP48_05830 [Mergibacter septicus]|uniref:VTT domain-containing protein n=1 Tax=Mergibacter septicus TaxID=221402 RepID=A0A8D4J2L9_9PAST|nr:YqaA family protein [Mergibacter septicus]AWX15720.1 hypothetical protein CEP47_05830 [Mergibacter septicus]QDJ14973.1 hypothetical protein CEP48_05830 [Mergibacter septicus]UTU47602.1 DedA family protein [Mergibacter septicus]WMR96792.1 YqaA family protein [Mergibacter septicus]
MWQEEWQVIWLWLEQHNLWLMFLSAFSSSTILPGSSEVVFSSLAFHLFQQIPVDYLAIHSLFWIAVIGNSLGSLTTYLLGRFFPQPTRFLHPDSRTEKILIYTRRYGSPILFFSWLPVIGDLLCGIAGWLQLRFLPTILFITLGKAVRYALLLAVFFH